MREAFQEESNKENKRIYSNHDLFCLILPLIAGLALDLVVGMLDTVMVSSTGESAVSGVSLVDSVMQLLIYIFAALASGGAVVAGQYLGAGNSKRAKQATEELLWLNALLSVFIMLLMFLTFGWILRHLFGSITADVYGHARSYFVVVIASIPAIGIYEAGTAVFRSMNDSKTTMKISLVMNLMNCIGNVVLIYGCNMAARGAAISTLVSRWFAAIAIVVLLLDQKKELSIRKTFRHRFDRTLSRSIFAMGIPGGVENGIFQLGKIGILGLVASFGTSAITANAVTQTMASIEMIPGSAVQLAITAVISRCIGAGDYKQAKYYNKKLLKISYIAVMGLSLIMVLGLPLVLTLYNLSEETASLATSMFLWHAAGAVTLWPLAFDLPASLRAAGDVRFPMIASIFSMWVFRFGGAHLLANIFGLGAVGVWISMSMLDWGFRAVIYVIRWHSEKWKEKSVIHIK